MGGGGGNMDSGEPEFQIAPMIDCLLVLLIFFMSITTAEVLQIDKGIELPVAADAKKKEKAKTQEGALNLRWDPIKQKGVFSFLQKDYDTNVQELVHELRGIRERIPGYQIIIRGDKRLPAVEIQRAMSILGQAGFDNINFSTLNQE
jgi:biopolymer transport protein ExbD